MPGLHVLALFAGCNPTITVEDDRCELDLARVEPASAVPGETVIGYGDGPFVDERDTVVFVAGTRARVTSTNGGSDDCARCLQCRLEAGCSVCDTTCTGGELQSPARIGECFAAEPTDTGDELVVGASGGVCARCEFQVEFVVPDVSPGPTEVLVFGEIGTSRPVAFEVAAPKTKTP